MHDLISKEILNQVKEQTRLQSTMVRLLKDILNELRHNPTAITGGIIDRIGDSPMTPLVPGTTATYKVTPSPAGAPTVPPGSGWISSDPVNAPVTVEADGLTVTVAIPTTAAPTAETPIPFTLTWTYTNADGDQATASITDQIVAPVDDVTGGVITRTA